MNTFISYLKTLFASLLFFSTVAQAQISRSNVELINGRSVVVEEDVRQRVTEKRVRKGKKVHTFKAYGHMYLTFLATMMLTEYWYCNKSNLSSAINLSPDLSNPETPTCQDEMLQMAVDPSMHAGIVAMTYVSLSYSSFANRASRNILISIMKKKAKNPLKVLQVFNQSIGMGFGITAQTLINSTYNSPSLGKCFKKMKESVFGDSTIEEAMKTEICKEAYEGFVSTENGTVSEIRIAMISLFISSGVTGLALGTLRILGLVVGSANPTGILLKGFVKGVSAITKTGFVTANIGIEFFDRWIEADVRAGYHNWESKHLVSSDVSDLVTDIKLFNDKGPLFKKKKEPGFFSGLPGAENSVDKRVFPLMETIKSYNKHISYKRRSTIHIFVDSQSRWKQKTSELTKTFNRYKGFLTTILRVREERAAAQHKYLNGTDLGYNPLFAVGKKLTRDDLKADSSLYQNELSLDDEQKEIVKTTLKKLLKWADKDRSVFERINLRSYEISLIHKVFKEIKENDFEELRFSLWRLRGALDWSKESNPYAGPRQDVVDEVMSVLHGVSSFHPALSDAARLLKSQELGFEQSGEEEQESSDGTGKSVARRKGVQISTEAADVLKLHPDIKLRTPHVGLQLGNFLTHAACNPNKDIIFDYNKGDISKVTLPHLVDFANGESIDCGRNTNIDRALVSKDFYLNPRNQKIVHIETSHPTHSIFTYRGKRYIGLLDLLTDPEVEIRLNSEEELKEYWETQMRPSHLNLLGQAKEYYHEFLYEEFKLFNESEHENGGASNNPLFFNKSIALYKPLPSKKTLSTEHVEQKIKVEGKDQYEDITMGEAFLDQIQVSLYIFEKLGLQNERADFLKSYFANLHKLLKLLDITNYTEPQPIDAFDLKELKTHPLVTLLGSAKHRAIAAGINSLNKALADQVKALENHPDFDPEKVKTEGLSKEDALKMIEKEVFKSLRESFREGVSREIFSDYLTGEGFVYIPDE